MQTALVGTSSASLVGPVGAEPGSPVFGLELILCNLTSACKCLVLALMEVGLEHDIANS